MLPISNFTIRLDASKDYVRIAILLHLLTCIILVRSDLPWPVIMILGSVLMAILLAIIYTKNPLSNYRQLTYHPGYWLLEDRSGHEVAYDKARIHFHGGFYIILRLTGKTTDKKLIIFKDQLTHEQYRCLELMKLNDH